MAKILIKVPCPAMGDTLCSTPTIRKISESYNQKVDVLAVRTDVLARNPYINNLISFNSPIEEYDEVFDTFVRSIKVNKHMDSNVFYDKGIEIKLANFEARQVHALCAGISLYPNELHCDYIPTNQTSNSLKITKNFVVLHVTESWPNRTWEINKWQRLINLIKTYTDLKIVTIGKSHSELAEGGKIEKNIIRLNNIDYDFCFDDKPIDQSHHSGDEEISEMWHIINNAYGLISFDSGPIHLAGTTDSWIFQIGASVRPEKTTPWRNSSQNYKFKFIGGECKIFCASCPKYSVKEHGTINSVPYIPECLENYTEYKCQPSPDEVFYALLKTYKNG